LERFNRKGGGHGSQGTICHRKRKISLGNASARESKRKISPSARRNEGKGGPAKTKEKENSGSFAQTQGTCAVTCSTGSKNLHVETVEESRGERRGTAEKIELI